MVPQPKHKNASAAAAQSKAEEGISHPNGVVVWGRGEYRHNPVGVDNLGTAFSQGSSVRAGLADLATVGFEAESLWDS